MVRWRNLDCRGQIEDDLLEMLRPCPSPSFFDSFAHFQRKLGLSLRERLWAVLEAELGSMRFRDLIGELAEDLRMLYGEGDSLLLRVLEDDGAEER